MYPSPPSPYLRRLMISGGIGSQGLRNLRGTCPAQNNHRCRCDFRSEETGQAYLRYAYAFAFPSLPFPALRGINTGYVCARRFRPRDA